MKKTNISILPQDVSSRISHIVREEDPNAIIYPTSIVLTEAKRHFTKEEVDFIKDQQKTLFQIASREIRVLVIKSDVLTQEQVSSFLYIDQYNQGRIR